MIEFLLIYIFVTYIAMFFLGYWVAKSNNIVETVGDSSIEIYKKAKSRFTPKIPTGYIKPKTAEDIKRINMPQKKKEGLDAMRETLGDLRKNGEL